MRQIFTAVDTFIGLAIDAICIVLTAGLFFLITLVVATRLGGFGSRPGATRSSSSCWPG